MADLSDVSTALETLITSTLYPSGTDTSDVSAAGVVATIFVGWPGPQAVDDAMAAGTTLVSIYPQAGAERNTTRFQPLWRELSLPSPTYTLTASNDDLAITVGGAAPVSYFAQNLYARINGTSYCYTAQDGDGAETVAAGLGALIAADFSAVTVSGASITLPAECRLQALRVGVTGTKIKEVGRQDRTWQIIIWAPTDDARTAIAKVIDPKLRQTPRLTLADETYGHLSYRSSPVTDTLQKATIFRRDLIYACEFGTTVTEAAEQIVEFGVNITRNIDDTGVSSFSFKI